MCTNESDILYEYDFKDPDVVADLKKLNNFVEIIYKVGDKWIKECYVRSQLLDSIIPTYTDATTLWGDGSLEQRVKMIAKLPLTGEFILERSVRYLSNPRFTSFLKYDCNNRKVGSYFAMSTFHGSEQRLCRLVPIEQDDGDNSFRVSIDGEKPVQYSQMLFASTNMSNPLDPNDRNKGFFVGEMFYYKNELNYYLNNFSNMIRSLQSSLEDTQNRSMDESIMLTIIPKILYRIEKIIQGKQHFNALKIEFNLIKPSLRTYSQEIQYMETIESLLNNKTLANPNGYGEWIYFNNILSGNDLTRDIDIEPVRKEIRAYWEMGKIEGPLFLIQSDSTERVINRIAFVENENALFNHVFYGKKEGQDIQIGKIEENNEEPTSTYMNFNEKYDSRFNRFGFESMLRQEVFTFCAYTYFFQTDEDYIKRIIEFIMMMNLNIEDTILGLPRPNDSNVVIYKQFMSNDFMISNVLKYKTKEKYYATILDKLTGVLYDEDEVNLDIVSTFLDYTPVDIKQSYTQSETTNVTVDGLNLMFLVVPILEKEPDFIIEKMKEMAQQGVNLNHTDSIQRTLFHYVFYNFEVYLRRLDIIDISVVENMFRTLFAFEGVDVNKVDKNGLTILHQAVMIKNYDVTELVKIILSKSPDLTIMSKIPAEATALELAILFEQPETVTNALREAGSPPERNISEINKKRNYYNYAVEFFDVPEDEQEEKSPDDEQVIEEEEEEDEEQEQEEDEEEEEEDEEEDLDRFYREQAREFNEEDDYSFDDKNEMAIDSIIMAESYDDIVKVIEELNEVNDITDSFNNGVGHAIMMYVERNNLDIQKVKGMFEKLLEKGYDINQENEDGETAIMLYVKNTKNDIEAYNMMKLLAEEFKAFINKVDKEGHNLIYYTKLNNLDKSFKYLKNKGANID